jgi:spore maturation protein CgeB
VYDGLAAGFAANGVEVVPFRWHKTLELMNMLVTGSVASGLVNTKKSEDMLKFATNLAAADALAYALEYQVDAVLCITGTLFPPQRADLLRKLGIPVACYGTEAPYFLDLERVLAPHYDYWFTQERTAVPALQAAMPNHHAFYLPMAYNPETHQPAPIDVGMHADVVFVGGGYPERKQLLDAVDWSDIDLVKLGTLWDVDIPAIRAEQLELGSFARKTDLGKNSIPNTETSAWHRSARIALNMHRQMTFIECDRPIGKAESIGPRAYEIPAVGGFCLSDDERPELFDVYGDSAATFKAWDAADLERQVRYWLSHDDEREAKQRAQFEAVQPHTWTARASQILETIL